MILWPEMMMRILPRMPSALQYTALAACLIPIVVHADPVRVRIDGQQTSDPVTQYEYGMFIEPIGALIARTLWAEMLDDRKFYYAIVAEGKDQPPPRSVEGRPGFSCCAIRTSSRWARLPPASRRWTSLRAPRF
jgi:hypothetical protein